MYVCAYVDIALRLIEDLPLITRNEVDQYCNGELP